MKNIAVAGLLFLVLLNLTWGRPADETYTDQFDNFDVDEVLKSDRLLNNYINCLKTGKKCTPEGAKLREIFPDALKTSCAKCTEVQRRQGKKVINYIVKNKPQVFRSIEEQFDPEHEYRAKYSDELAKDGVVIPPLSLKP